MIIERPRTGAIWPVDERVRYVPIDRVSRLDYIASLLCYPAIQADSEMYQRMKKALVVFGEAEEVMTQTQLYDRLSRAFQRSKNRSTNERAPSHLTLAVLHKANRFLDDNQQMLDTLSSVYDKRRFFYQSPDQIRQITPVIDVLVDTLQAVESNNIKSWYAKDDPEKEVRRLEIQEFVLSQNNIGLMVLCDRATTILESRADFWQTELASVVTHPAVIDLDKTIREYHDPEELRVETLA